MHERQVWGLLSEDTSSRTSYAYKYTRTEGSKICNTYVLQIQKGSSSLCANGQPSSINLFGKNGRDKKPSLDSGGKGNKGNLFSESDHMYCRIPARTLNAREDKAPKEIKNLSSK